MRPWKELIFYKLDRTLAIAGLVVIGIWSLYKGQATNPIALAVVGSLGVYIGGRGIKPTKNKP